MPQWQIPEDLPNLLETDPHGIWEDDTWAPILLSVMTGTVYCDRPIAMAWQIEFSPTEDVFKTSNGKLQLNGIEPDGYGWATLIKTVATKYHPEIADGLQFGDTEDSTCVVWVESEEACRTLMQMTWALIHGT